MLKLVTFLLLCHYSIQNPIKVSIYYESLCIDSIQFIKHQLAPNYEKLKHNITLDFVPYGKATHSKVSDIWTFTCQHGPNECKGNIMQSCGLQHASNQDTKMAFVKCIMSSRNPASRKTAKRCSTSSGVAWGKVKKCYDSTQGKELLAINGDKTYDVQPSINFVPTIIFNDKYDDYLKNRAVQDLGNTIINLLAS